MPLAFTDAVVFHHAWAIVGGSEMSASGHHKELHVQLAFGVSINTALSRYLHLPSQLVRRDDGYAVKIFKSFLRCMARARHNNGTERLEVSIGQHVMRVDVPCPYDRHGAMVNLADILDTPPLVAVIYLFTCIARIRVPVWSSGAPRVQYMSACAHFLGSFVNHLPRIGQIRKTVVDIDWLEELHTEACLVDKRGIAGTIADETLFPELAVVRTRIIAFLAERIATARENTSNKMSNRF